MKLLLTRCAFIFFSILVLHQVTASAAPSSCSNSDTPSPSSEECKADSNTMAEEKTEWPELEGKTGEEAKTVIERENPNLAMVHVVPKDAMMTMDYRTDRVRILVDKEGKVAQKPRVG